MFIIFTGNGKGKTTAALGQALRAVGSGKRVLMIQFIKGPWKSGEDTACQALAPHLTIVKKGKGFVGLRNDPYPHSVHEEAARTALAFARKKVKESQPPDILILDEVWNALYLNLVTEAEVSDCLTTVLQEVEHVITTGRHCPQSFIDRADLVTEMREIKHPFSNGVYGSRGLEY